MVTTTLPEVVSAQEWQRARDELMVAENEATRALDGTTFAEDCQVGPGFRLSVLLRQDEDIYLTYYTVSRGVDRMLWDYSVLDLTPFGRQESWEQG